MAQKTILTYLKVKTKVVMGVNAEGEDASTTGLIVFANNHGVMLAEEHQNKTAAIYYPWTAIRYVFVL